jgi:cytochrome P450
MRARPGDDLVSEFAIDVVKIGASSVRLEAGIALPALLARFPSLPVDAARDEMRFRGAFVTRGLLGRPVRW